MPYRVGHATFNLHGKVLRKRVALSEEMSETEPVLFSVNPNHMDKVELLRNILPTSNVNAVSTRRQAQTELSNLDPIVIDSSMDEQGDVVIDDDASASEIDETMSESDDEISVYAESDEEDDGVGNMPSGYKDEVSESLGGSARCTMAVRSQVRLIWVDLREWEMCPKDTVRI